MLLFQVLIGQQTVLMLEHIDNVMPEYLMLEYLNLMQYRADQFSIKLISIQPFTSQHFIPYHQPTAHTKIPS
jgi:hypothetical protein